MTKGSVFVGWSDIANIKWSSHDTRRAQAEGWCLFDFGSYGGRGVAAWPLQQRGKPLPPESRFESDAEAEDFVKACAALGSRFHQKAVHFLDD